MLAHLFFLREVTMERVIIGQIVNTHGIKGELKVKSSTDFVEERFEKNAHVYIDDHGQMIDQDINRVEKYKGCFLYADKDLELLDDDEYYVGDLIGCEVYQNEQKLGQVSDVQLYDHHDILVVKGKQKIMIPYVEAFVKEVDIDQKRIDVTLIEGFYDED